MAKILSPTDSTDDLAPPGESFCPRCGAGRLRAWGELTDEEREAVRRLPASTDYPFDERAARHTWCALCWHEETGDRPRAA